MLLKIRPAKINFYLRFMTEHGFDIAQVLDGSSISASSLDDPNYLIDITQYVRIVVNIKRLYQSQSLAFDLGDAVTISDLGILGYALMSSDNTAVGQGIYQQYSSLFFGNLIDLTYRSENGRLIAEMTPFYGTQIRHDLMQFFVEERFAISYKTLLLCGYKDNTFPVEEWFFTHEKPDDEVVKRYSQIFNVPIHFSSPTNSVVISDNGAIVDHTTADEETFELCLNHLDKLYTNYLNHDKFTTRVNHILFNNLSSPPTIDKVATELCCSKRTLNRKLLAEGSTFAELVSQSRLDAIINFVAATDYSHERISEETGFSDARSLRRFFKSKTGHTISEYKEKLFADFDQPT